MQNFLYAIQDENDVLTGFVLSYSDKEAVDYFKHLLDSSYLEIKDDVEKGTFIIRIRKSCIVRVASIDVMTHDVKNDYNVLAWLNEFKKEVQVKCKDITDPNTGVVETIVDGMKEELKNGKQEN